MSHGLLETLDEGRILRALDELGREAARHRFEVAPNPCVGAALYAGERELARGFHRFWGGPHAEVDALSALAEDAERPELLVVTLEPCSSRGKTGPCVGAILAAGIRRVAVGQLDPDPRHRGQGLELLREAGVEVLLLEHGSPLERTCPHFLSWTSQERLRRPRPWTIAKWAQTRTGQLSPPEHVGGGRWISGPEAMAEVQLLRGRVDAIVTGVGTVLADDPRLTVRPPGDVGRPPLRVVLDGYLRTPPDAALFRPPAEDEGAGEVHLLTLAGMDPGRARALSEAGAGIHGLHAVDERVSLRDVQRWLWERGARRVLLECGPTLLDAHLDQGFVDQIRVYTGAVNGGRGPTLGEWLAPQRLKQRADRETGDDAVLEAFTNA